MICVVVLMHKTGHDAHPLVDSEPAMAAATASDWTALPNIKNPRFESTAIQFREDLYVFNGFGPGIKIEPTVEKFDAQTLTWSVIGKTSVAKGNAVTHNGFVVDGNEVWIIGGRPGNHPGPVTSDVWKFNLDDRTWSAGPELPVPGAAGGAALVDGRIHWFGGLDTRARCDVDNHYVYDLSNPSAGWSDISSVAPMPVPRNHFATVVLDGLIYVIGGQFTHGGCGGGTPDTRLSHRFDPKTNTWDQIASLPAVQSHIEPSTFAYKGAIYVVGGATNGTSVYRYDPDNDQWDTVAELPQALLAPIARVVGDELIVSSGGAPSVVPTVSTYKTDMLPLLLSVAAEDTDSAEIEPAPVETDANDGATVGSDLSTESLASDDPINNTNRETDTSQPNTGNQSISDQGNSLPEVDDAGVETSEAQSEIDNACDYSRAQVNNGWGWNPVSKVSCPPLATDIVQSSEPMASIESDQTPTPPNELPAPDDLTQNSEQVQPEEPKQKGRTGIGPADPWLILLSGLLSALRIFPVSGYRRQKQ